ILIISFLFLDCSKKVEKKDEILKTAALAGISSEKLPRIDTESIPESPAVPVNEPTPSEGDGSESTAKPVETTNTDPINEAGNSSESELYRNQYLPEDFSLKIPTKPETLKNEVNMSRCYIDQAVEMGDVSSTNSRLCGLAFDQVKLELHALFLDLALPHIRALCKNKLPSCDLEGEVIDITVSEPVVRKVQKLYAFYDYVGLNQYFQYNGYEINNGAKFPYKLRVYEEIDHPVYEYRAVIIQRTISTRGTEVEERPDTAEITVLWDKTRKNILFQFHGFAEVFDYKINARRVYDYSMADKRINYTTELDYWHTKSDLAFRLGQSGSIVECDKSEDCIQHSGIAGFYVGSDSEANGITGPETYYHSFRISSGIAKLDGGIVHNIYPETGYSDQMLLYKSGNELEYTLNPDTTFTKKWGFSNSSPNQEEAELKENLFWQNYLSLEGKILNPLITAKITRSELIPEFPNRIFWQSTEIPTTPVPLNGYGLTGNQTFIQIRFKELEDKAYRSLFLPDGSREYTVSGGF
ncbi:MAG: hypothetical protein KDK45_20680, partial [Leptospiraceae bacterium]|nr:hypothetical protein [Leptospiraceae bacterium]